MKRLILALAALALPSSAFAQTNLQLWGNFTLNWLKSDRLSYELDFEPKVLLVATGDDPAWHSLDVTPNVEYAWKRWLDVIGELATGTTRQSDDVNTFELTPRAGARFHLLSRDVPRVGPRLRERPPWHRIVIRDLVRIEGRNLFYFGAGSGSDSTVRFRNRLEFLVPLNKERLTDDGARYLLADWEWFIPLDDPDERFASRQRVRAGLGWRRNVHWRIETLYIWSRSRNTIEEGFTTSDHIIDIRVKRVF